MSDKKIKFKGNIRKAMITGKDTIQLKFVDHRMINEDPANNTVSSNWDRPVHKDLKATFKVLLGHAAVIGEFGSAEIDSAYITSRKCVVDPELSSYSVVGFEYKKDDEEKMVSLHLVKNLSSGESYKFQLPFVGLYQDSDYEFSGNLEDDLSDCEIEIAKYQEGKFNDHGQTTMFIDDEGGLVSEDVF